MPPKSDTYSIFTITDNIHFVQGAASNWTVLTSGTRFTLVDSGYPNDYKALIQSLRDLKLDPKDCMAVLLTHAHIDHVGGALQLRQDFGTPIWCHQKEERNLTGAAREQVAPKTIYKKLWNLRILFWAVHAIKLGGTQSFSTNPDVIFNSDPSLDLPGRPQPIVTPGHTSGHTSYLISSDSGKVIITGDALVSKHPTSWKRTGRQMLPNMFHATPDQAEATYLNWNITPETIILPGHGPILTSRLETEKITATRETRT
ncbi:MBL fold metallo-hydrolase [Acaricomes phytoseiuli]|uniref:MBL fold metallo-hydrolase n=1 Tax=Acaricomes phytoseiuli TaxID=291968 RepID=UPI0003750990|nr:MBL fold metallo-hydrolase [Acaricomes phytoseiuli]